MHKRNASLCGIALAVALPLAMAWQGQEPAPGAGLCGRTIDFLLRAHGPPTSVTASDGGFQLDYALGQKHARLWCHGDIVVHVEGADALPVFTGKLPLIYPLMPVADAMAVLGNPAQAVLGTAAAMELDFADGRRTWLAHGRLLQVPAK
jgi:hypothetical protein